MASEVMLELREGFHDDEVEVSAAGMTTLRQAGVTTRLQTGLARSVALELPAGASRLCVALPLAAVASEASLPPTRPLWVGASLSRGRDALTLEVRTTPFGYV